MRPRNPVLLTGATGYVGPFVSKALQAQGCRVRAAVRRRPSPPLEGAELIQIADDGDLSALSQAMEPGGVVVHLAGRAHVFDETEADPESAYRRANTDLTVRLARAAAAAKTARFVFMSSVKVYGDASDRVLSEADPVAPTDAYGRSKAAAEHGLKSICEASGMTFSIIRSPMVYGPRCKGNVPRLMRLIARKLPLPFASVHNRRSMIGVENLADIVVRCALSDAAENETFVVADGPPTSTRQLIEALALGMGITPRLMPFPPALLRLGGRLAGFDAEVQRLVGSLEFDNSHVMNKLGWSAIMTTSEGLASTGRSFLAGQNEVCGPGA